MTADHVPFLAAICAAPDDDAPRLVYADWLEDNGEPERAEFIRAQCELTVTTCDLMPYRSKSLAGPIGGRFVTCACRYCTLKRREEELLNAHSAEWFPIWANHSHGWGKPDNVHRGFLQLVACTAADWLAHHAALAWHPDHCDWPCPPTAQPIKVVRLTGELSVQSRRTDSGFSFYFVGDPDRAWESGPLPRELWMTDSLFMPQSTVLNVCKFRWPWLTVELPPERIELQAHRLPIHVNVPPELIRVDEEWVRSGH